MQVIIFLKGHLMTLVRHSSFHVILFVEAKKLVLF